MCLERFLSVLREDESGNYGFSIGLNKLSIGFDKKNGGGKQGQSQDWEFKEAPNITK